MKSGGYDNLFILTFSSYFVRVCGKTTSFNFFSISNTMTFPCSGPSYQSIDDENGPIGNFFLEIFPKVEFTRILGKDLSTLLLVCFPLAR